MPSERGRDKGLANGSLPLVLIMVDDAAEVGYVDRAVDAVYWDLGPVEAIGERGDIEVTHERWRGSVDGG